jgi:hypothetical protein
MSDEPTPDPLLAALRQLPTRTVTSSAEARLRREARASYVRRFEGSAWHSSATNVVSRFAVPAFLAGIVGIYMSWAMTAAATLLP